jgi:hypothetical protein
MLSFGAASAGGSDGPPPWSGDPIATYGTSKWQRGMALIAGAGAIVFAGLVVAGPQSPLSWGSLLQIGTTGGMMVAAAAYGLHARIEVFEDGLRKVRPLWRDETIRFDAVERALLPMTSEGLMLFAGGQAQFQVDGDAFEHFDRLVLQVCRRLPDTAEIEDPADRLDGYRDGDGRDANGLDAED